MTIEQARTNMLKQQIRACYVLDEHILSIIEQTPREFFVPTAFQSLAFIDEQLPLDHGEVMMTPFEEAVMLQNLQVNPDDSILEVGTGTGYTTSLFSKLGKQVTTMDIYPDFIENAQTRINTLKLKNIKYMTGDIFEKFTTLGTFEVIAMTGSVPTLPESFKKSMAIGGRLFAIVGNAPAMSATIMTRLSDNEWEEKKLFETVIKPLINAPTQSAFVF